MDTGPGSTKKSFTSLFQNMYGLSKFQPLHQAMNQIPDTIQHYRLQPPSLMKAFTQFRFGPYVQVP